MYSLKTFGLWLGFHKVWYLKKTPFNKMIRDHSGHGHSQWQKVLMFPIGCDHTKNYVWMNNSIFLRPGSNDRLPIYWYLTFVVRHLGIAPISRFGPRQLGIPSCRTQSRDWHATGIATWRPLREYWRSVSAQLPRQLAAFETYLMAHYDTGIFTDV